MEELKDYMRGLRKKAKLTLKGAAEGAGVSVTYIWQVEKGLRVPSAEAIKKIAPVYQTSIFDMMEAAGHVEKPNVSLSENERIKLAFKLVESDPEFKFGTRLTEKELTPDVMKYIIEIYEKASGKKLL